MGRHWDEIRCGIKEAKTFNEIKNTIQATAERIHYNKGTTQSRIWGGTTQFGHPAAADPNPTRSNTTRPKRRDTEMKMCNCQHDGMTTKLGHILVVQKDFSAKWRQKQQNTRTVGIEPRTSRKPFNFPKREL
jgi:hypothetical protein